MAITFNSILESQFASGEPQAVTGNKVPVGVGRIAFAQPIRHRDDNSLAGATAMPAPAKTCTTCARSAGLSRRLTRCPSRKALCIASLLVLSQDTTPFGPSLAWPELADEPKGQRPRKPFDKLRANGMGRGIEYEDTNPLLEVGTSCYGVHGT